MDGYIIGAAVGEAVLPTMLFYGLAVAAIRSRRNEPLGWLRGSALFGLAVALVGLSNIVIYAAAPGQIMRAELNQLAILQSLLIPLTVSVLVLLLFWKGPADEN